MTGYLEKSVWLALAIIWLLLLAGSLAGCGEKTELDMLNAGCVEEARVDTGRTRGNMKVGYSKVYRVTYACPAMKQHLEVSQ